MAGLPQCDAPGIALGGRACKDPACGGTSLNFIRLKTGLQPSEAD